MDAPATPIIRPSARVILVDTRQRVLLLASRMPDGVRDERLWVSPGGAIEPGETAADAARRELREETGLDLPVGPCIWHRDHTWFWASQASWYRSIEQFFIAHTELTEVDTSGWTPQERDILITPRWWSVEELVATHDVIAPRNLASLLPPLLAGQLPTNPIMLTE